ncbi:MAG: hypothetical protein K5636_06900 [Bacteroidales bacterium]|nr:hypothetical protein [Bacteroidales bacterium]
MKKILSLILSIMLVAGAMAQKPSLTKAYNNYYDKNFSKAKEAIDLCVQDEKLSTKAQTWLYKGNIYYFLSNEEYGAKQKDSTYQIVYPDAPVEAYDAFAKAAQINSNVEAMDMFTPKEAMKQLYPLLLVRGVDQLIAKDYNGAKNTLEKGIESYEMDKPQYPMNGELYYYYAYTLEMLDMKDDVRTYYEKAANDGSSNPYVYVRLIESYKAENNPTMAKKILDGAKTKLPGNTSIALAEIDYYYWIKDSVQARRLLNGIAPNSIHNADELVNLSNCYIKEKRYEEAIRFLERANAMSSGNYVVLYNLGVCEYSLSEQLFNQYNQLAISNPNDPLAASCKHQSDEHISKSARYFEQARTLEPEDLNLLNTLRAIYARQQSPKYDEIDAIIKSLEKN